LQAAAQLQLGFSAPETKGFGNRFQDTETIADAYCSGDTESVPENKSIRNGFQKLFPKPKVSGAGSVKSTLLPKRKVSGGVNRSGNLPFRERFLRCGNLLFREHLPGS
jgi:hypothetical protein